MSNEKQETCKMCPEKRKVGMIYCEDCYIRLAEMMDAQNQAENNQPTPIENIGYTDAF